MSFANYKNTNNADSRLISSISASATMILIKEGDQNIFPNEFPFLLTLEHEDVNGNVTTREIVKVTGMNQNSLTIERSAGKCVQDDTATNRIQDNVPHSFSAGDKISLYFTSEQVEEIRNNMGTLTKSEAVANLYSETKEYIVGDIVMYDGERYEAIEETTGPFDETKRKKSQIQELIFDLEKKVKTLSTNSLSENYIVGDKYTANDNLYIQTPATLENSTIEQNIGDVDGNKEIHIQQIGNGKGSDTLKLKIKKIGQPTTTLRCELQKGVLFDVSETESARAGNGTAIATSSVSYTDITTERQEITLTFNKEFGKVEGELLDVVLYQDGKIVNSGNYYQIACDSTQSSESNRCVCVNGEEKTTNNYMPYCSSICFEDKLLSKTADFVKNGELGSTPIPYILTNNSDQTLNFSFRIGLSGYGASTAKATLIVYDTGGSIVRQTDASRTGSSSQGSRGTNQTRTITVGPTERLEVRQVSGASIMSITGTPGIFPKKSDYGILYFPGNNVVGEIGTYGPAGFFGKKGDDFVLGVESSTRTTGSISPGNCQGFLQIGKYKIPYYGI